MKTEYEDVYGWRLQNDNKPIWTRNPKARALAVRAGGAPGRACAFVRLRAACAGRPRRPACPKELAKRHKQTS